MRRRIRRWLLRLLGASSEALDWHHFVLTIDEDGKALVYQDGKERPFTPPCSFDLWYIER